MLCYVLHFDCARKRLSWEVYEYRLWAWISCRSCWTCVQIVAGSGSGPAVLPSVTSQSAAAPPACTCNGTLAACTLPLSRVHRADIRHGTGSLGHRVSGSFGSSCTSGAPGHRVIILTRCETRVFPVCEKMSEVQNVHLKCWNDKSHCHVSVVGLKSLDVSPCNELSLLPMIIKNSLAWEYFFVTFGVHYRTGSPGQLGLRVAGFPGHWVAGSQNVTQFHVWLTCDTASQLAYETPKTCHNYRPHQRGR